MGTPTQIYVDPAIAADSGTGTIGDPFGDLQYALNTVTRDATNGDQFNIKAGTDEILAAALSLATYGTPSVGAPLIFRGYTSAANDGGIGVINGNAGNFSIIGPATLDAIIIKDLRLTNCGSAVIVNLDTFIIIENCQIDTSTGGGISINANGLVSRCFVWNCSGNGIEANTSPIRNNYLKNGTNTFTNAILAEANGVVANNIISIGGASVGILRNGSGQSILHNSIYSSGGTGAGISLASGGTTIVEITNNIIEGFSGVGGKGIAATGAIDIEVYGHNKFYNNSTHESSLPDTIINLGNNDTLGASPFTDPANDDFSVSAAVKAGAYPSSFYGSNTDQFLDVGAAQRMEFTARARYLMGIG